MYVWLVYAGHDYEGEDLVGAFDSEKKGRACFEKIPLEGKSTDVYYDRRRIDKVVVQ